MPNNYYGGGGAVMGGQGLGAPLITLSDPVNGTDEVQRITITGTPTGGTFRLNIYGYQTAAIAYNAAAAAVVAALEALPCIGAGNVTGSGGALPGSAVDVKFTLRLGRFDHDQMTATNSLTGGTSPTITISTPTPGVRATHRGAAKGARLINQNTGAMFSNRGTEQAPNWVGDSQVIYTRTYATEADPTVLTDAQGASSDVILLTGSASGAVTITLPLIAKNYTVINASGQAATIQRAGQTSPPTLANGKIGLYVCDGTDIKEVFEQA